MSANTLEEQMPKNVYYLNTITEYIVLLYSASVARRPGHKTFISFAGRFESREACLARAAAASTEATTTTTDLNCRIDK
jgi:hypothetical protein